MNHKDIIFVMKKVGYPVTPKKIVTLLQNHNLDFPKGKTPEKSVSRALYTSLKKHGESSPYRKVHSSKGLFTYNPEYSFDTEKNPRLKFFPHPPLSTNEDKYPSFTNCAESVLKQQQGPLHYRDITRIALEKHILNTRGKTPEASMYAQILSENKRRKARAERPRFICYGRGMIGLTEQSENKLEEQIERQNHETKQKLLKNLQAMEPKKFEELVALVFTKMGFKEVAPTQYTRDGGVDVRGVLEVEGVININLAIQAKRASTNVQRQVVDALRGCLSTGERGVIVTTGDFSKNAQKTARDGTKNCFIDLINGEAFVNLMVEHEVGIKRNEYQILYLRDMEEQDEE